MSTLPWNGGISVCHRVSNCVEIRMASQCSEDHGSINYLPSCWLAWSRDYNCSEAEVVIFVIWWSCKLKFSHQHQYCIGDCSLEVVARIWLVALPDDENHHFQLTAVSPCKSTGGRCLMEQSGCLILLGAEKRMNKAIQLSTVSLPTTFTDSFHH